MRKPSLHILEKDLSLIIEEWFENNNLQLNPDKLVNEIMIKGKKRQITSRSILESNKSIASERILSSSLSDAQIFNTHLNLLRTSKNHRFSIKIREGSKDWEFIKEATNLANNFHEMFRDTLKSKKEAFVEYIKIFLDILEGPFSIRRLPPLHDRICSTYENNIKINNSTNLPDAEIAHELYQKLIFEKTGNKFNYRNKPDQFIHFILCCEIANDLGISIKQYIVAQFESLNWAGGIPYPQQLSNEKGKERAIRWMAQNNVQKSSKSMTNNQLVKALKEIGKNYENNT